MSPAAEATSPKGSRDGGLIARIAALAALALVVITVLYLFFAGGDDGNKYKLLFETGGQLVKDNEVLIGGQPVGSVDSIELTDDGLAEVEISLDRELHEGTSAVIRSTSLSGVANRYISITPGPDNADEIPEGGFITQADTTTPVDLDQLFNTFRASERKALQDIIEGSATVYAGRGPEANETYKYLSPSIVAANRLFSELNRDEQVLTDFLVRGSRVVTGLAERRDDLAGLVSNGNQFLGAIANQNESLDRALEVLPPTLRQANTTFFNLRLALDDLDPLVEDAKPATKNLAPFLRQFKRVAKKSVPVFSDLRLAVNRNGKNNDLADAAADLGPLEANAASSVQPAIDAMVSADPVLRYNRPYVPDIMAGIGRLNAVTGFYDANGHYARVAPAGLNVFNYNSGTQELEPIPPSQQFAGYGAFGGPNFKVFLRCPGGATQPIVGSNPFLDGGNLVPGPPFPAGDCNPNDVPPGP